MDVMCGPCTQPNVGSQIEQLARGWFPIMSPWLQKLLPDDKAERAAHALRLPEGAGESTRSKQSLSSPFHSLAISNTQLKKNKIQLFISFLTVLCFQDLFPAQTEGNV